jgi:hypothetical protein
LYQVTILPLITLLGFLESEFALHWNQRKTPIDHFIGSMHFSMHFFIGTSAALIRLVSQQAK